MGLFGFVKKAIGGIVKKGLGLATHGVSDSIFDFIDARKRQQHLQPIANQLFNVKPKVKGGNLNKSYLGFDEAADIYGLTPGEVASAKGRARAKKRAKAQAKKRAELDA